MAVILVRSNIFNERGRKRSSPPRPQKVCQCVKGKHLKCWTFGQPCTVLTWGVEDPKSRQCSQWWPSVVQSPTLAVIPWKMFLSLSFIETLPNVCSVVYGQPGVKWQETSDNQLLLRRSSSGQWSPWRGPWALQGTIGQWYFLASAQQPRVKSHQ